MALIAEAQSNGENNQNRIDNHETDIVKLTTNMTMNAQNIQTLLNNFRDSLLRFHVETKISPVHWPSNTVVTYETKLLDTHKAMEIESGVFTAPLRGVYGFFFDSHFNCDITALSLYLYHNDLKIEIHVCKTSFSNNAVITSNNVYFARKMEVGDTLKIISGNSDFNFGYFPVKFMGFLLKKYYVLFLWENISFSSSSFQLKLNFLLHCCLNHK